MKNNHTQLTRLAAISLCLVMCLSALPMLAPSAAASGSGTYVWTVAGDGHYGAATNPNGEANQALVARITGDGTQRHFDNGDLVQTLTSIDQYEAIKSIYDTGLDSVPYHVSIGNHDYPEWLMDTFEMDRRQYTIVDGDYAWIVLDSSRMYSYMNPYSHKYLEEQLDLLRDKLVFVIAHVPQRVLQPTVSPSSVDNPYFINAIQSHAYHIGAVIFSHTHVADYQYIDGVPWVTTGSYGKATYGSPPSYVLFEVTSSGREHVITIRERGLDPEDNDHMFGPQTHTVTVPPVTITPPVDVSRVTYVWDGEGADNKASTAANWYCVDGGVINNDVLPTSGSAILFNEESPKNCTWDLAISPYSFTLEYGYTGRVIQASGLHLEIGYGGYWQWGGEFLQIGPVSVAGTTLIDNGLLIGSKNYVWDANGDVYIASGCLQKNLLSLRMSGADALLWTSPYTMRLNSLEVAGSAEIRIYSSDSSFTGFWMTSHLVVGGTLTIADGSNPCVRRYDDGTYVNTGSIRGPGELRFALYNSDGTLPALGDVSCPIVVMLTIDATRSCTMSADNDIATDTLLIVRSYSPTYSITFDPDDHNVSVSSVTVEPRSVLVGGESRITTTSWDTTAGGWEPEGSTVILRDGGTVKLATGQSFNRLEIASEDGRTASWSMTATGTVAPIVTGLRSGSYLWYLDGVEQGEIEADEHGTIALSYQSTGLHTIEVTTPMTIAMDGVYQAVGIVAVLAVLGGLFTMVGRIKL
jgi:predicted phosphodiesterase